VKNIVVNYGTGLVDFALVAAF